MKNIEIGRYDSPETVGYVGWITAEKFHVFVALDGTPFVMAR